MNLSYGELKQQGWWIQENGKLETGIQAIKSALFKVSDPFFLIDYNGQPAAGIGGRAILTDSNLNRSVSEESMLPLFAYLPPLSPEKLGSSIFKNRHNLRYAYIMGAMANGISSVDMVTEAGSAGMVCFFGAGGLPLDEIETAILDLKEKSKNNSFGFNLIHSPADPEHEVATVDLYLKYNIRLVSASAFLDLTLPLIYFRVKGIHRDATGNIVCPNRIIAKVSRIEVARKFLSPPPEKFLNQLLEHEMITEEESILSRSVPMADDLTAEADSGGHTDNQPAITLLPTMLALRNEIVKQYNYENPVCVGLGGGISTPETAAAAFALGADFILTGSINQSCIEAGTSEKVCSMLAGAVQADVTMAPAADMFEMGIKVQVLKRGTMFAFRAAKLYDLYCTFNSLDEIPENERLLLERDFFRMNFQETWERTRTFFEIRDPKQVQRAEKDDKHKMALVFRSYLGQSSTWANKGEETRTIDYQIWCGPAIGAFNEWAKGTFLEKPENRNVVTVAMNLLYGASVATRINWLRSQGFNLPHSVEKINPLSLSDINDLLDSSADK